MGKWKNTGASTYTQPINVVSSKRLILSVVSVSSDICERYKDKLCAHRCVANGDDDSYHCECHDGFRLQADEKSCAHEQNSGGQLSCDMSHSVLMRSSFCDCQVFLDSFFLIRPVLFSFVYIIYNDFQLLCLKLKHLEVMGMERKRRWRWRKRESTNQDPGIETKLPLNRKNADMDTHGTELVISAKVEFRWKYDAEELYTHLLAEDNDTHFIE